MINDEIHVRVVKYPDRKNLMMRYTDPRSGKQISRSTGTTRRRDAERAAAKWETELRSGASVHNAKISWEAFRDRYETEVFPGQAKNTQNLNGTVFNAVEHHLRPVRLADLAEERLSYFQVELRKQGVSEATLRTYLAHLRSALNWAASMKLLTNVPAIKVPRRAGRSKKMKGRPLTEAEFDALLNATEEIVGSAATLPWKRLLQGLWLSGLRLSEALLLYWDRPDRLCVVPDGDYLMLAIPGELEKGNRDRVLPIAPEFSLFLDETSGKQREGPVFPLIDGRGSPRTFTMQSASKIISNIGKTAGVEVHRDVRTGKAKYASAHDLRRSFGERWARHVMPQVLKELMRHESIDTTLKYYVGVNAKMTTQALWDVYDSRQR